MTDYSVTEVESKGRPLQLKDTDDATLAQVEKDEILVIVSGNGTEKRARRCTFHRDLGMVRMRGGDLYAMPA